jgi:hypothetical protein
MDRSASQSNLPSVYNDFLYAPVGEDANGALLTVLSLLARQNVDPWEEAADLSRLPRDIAARRLTSMIPPPEGPPSALDRSAVADRLIALLPGPLPAGDSKSDAPPSAAPAHRVPPTLKLTVIAIYIGVMLLTQWIAASVFQRAPIDALSAPSHTSPATLPSTPRQE